MIKTKTFLPISLLVLCLLLGNNCTQQPYVQGERLYQYHCSGCHMTDGTGMAKLYPPVAEADYLQANLSNLPCMIRFGIQDSIVVNGTIYDVPMAGISTLSSAEIANISNFIAHKWYNHSMLFTEASVRKLLNTCTK